MTRPHIVATLSIAALLAAGCASTPPADRTVYRTSEAPAPDVEQVERLRSDSPRDPGTMTEDERREWFDARRPVTSSHRAPAPRYDQTLAPRVVERVRVERPVAYSWVPFTLGLGYLAYRGHRHHRRHHHRHHFHYGYHWGW